MKYCFTFILLFLFVNLFAQKEFAVEVGAYAEPVQKGYFGELKDIYETLDVNYIYRYYIDAQSEENAKEILTKVHDAGFPHARIINFEELKEQCNNACAYTPPKRTGKKIHTPSTTPSSYVDYTHLYPIFFDFDKYYLRKESVEELDKYVAVLSQNKDYKVIIFAHTDARGDDEYNIRLSNNRAKSAKNYLINHGIKSSRISIETFGERRPVAKNQSETGEDLEQGRQLNRRIEFDVLDNSGKVLNIVEQIRVPEYLKEY